LVEVLRQSSAVPALPRIAQLLLCNDLAIGGVYTMKLSTAGAEH
jgi:hypothetical protein